MIFCIAHTQGTQLPKMCVDYFDNFWSFFFCPFVLNNTSPRFDDNKMFLFSIWHLKNSPLKGLSPSFFSTIASAFSPTPCVFATSPGIVYSWLARVPISLLKESTSTPRSWNHWSSKQTDFMGHALGQPCWEDFTSTAWIWMSFVVLSSKHVHILIDMF